MIGTLPAAQLAPLDYRYALDAALAVLNDTGAPLVRCAVPALAREVAQRIPTPAAHAARAALWVEPLTTTWCDELAVLAGALPGGAPLAIVVSRPLAGLLPERRTWGGRPLGLRPGGIGRLCRALPRAGFGLEARYGIHTLAAIGLNLLSRQLERWGRPDLGDRLHAAARLRYCTHGPPAALATVALLIARKERG